jgi:hypothetical protein
MWLVYADDLILSEPNSWTSGAIQGRLLMFHGSMQVLASSSSFWKFERLMVPLFDLFGLSSLTGFLPL